MGKVNFGFTPFPFQSILDDILLFLICVNQRVPFYCLVADIQNQYRVCE